jgi:hypothetical protein
MSGPSTLCPPQRSDDPRALLPHDDNKPGGGCCPACNSPMSIAPALSEYRSYGIIHHHWHCRACDHEWTTVCV